MFCEKCGTAINENDRFCSHCGNKLSSVPETTESTAEESTPETITVEEIATVIGQVNDLEESSTFDSMNDVSETVFDSISEDIVEETDDDAAENMTEYSFHEQNEASEDIQDIPDDTEIQHEEDSHDHSSANKQTPTKPKLKIGAHILSSFLSIVLLAFVMLTIGVSVVQTVFNSSTITGMISAVDLRSIEIDDLADKGDLEELGLKCDSDNVLDVIYDNIDQTALADPLTKEEFEAIVENEAFSKYIGDVIGKNIEDITSGKSSSIISVDDITGFLETEKDTIADVIGYEITEERIENLRLTINNNYNDVFKSLEIDSLEDEVGKAAATGIVIVFSDWLEIILIIFDILIAILIFLIMRSFRFGFIYCGIPAVIAGGLYTLSSGLLLVGIINIFVSGVLAELINQLASAVMIKILIISASVLIAGILMLVIAKIINVVKKRRMA